MNALYELHNISQQYAARTVLSVPQLAIAEGEALALIGPSGAGKSTLLRLLCFLEAPTHGIISYEDRHLVPPVPLHVQRDITLVFQRPLLLDTSVRKNVAFGLRLRGERAEPRVTAMLELLGLAQVAQANARTLSGGEMQRVALARALVLRPRVLLLDEPTANLDPQNVALMENAITTLRRETGCTIVVATHNLHQARRLTTRTAMLLDGQLIEVDATDQVLANPNDQRTRAFVEGRFVY